MAERVEQRRPDDPVQTYSRALAKLRRSTELALAYPDAVLSSAESRAILGHIETAEQRRLSALRLLGVGGQSKARQANELFDRLGEERDELRAERDALLADVSSYRTALHHISLSPCYHDLDTPNERLLDEDEPCAACIAREALEKA